MKKLFYWIRSHEPIRLKPYSFHYFKIVNVENHDFNFIQFCKINEECTIIFVDIFIFERERT